MILAGLYIANYEHVRIISQYANTHFLGHYVPIELNLSAKCALSAVVVGKIMTE